MAEKKPDHVKVIVKINENKKRQRTIEKLSDNELCIVKDKTRHCYDKVYSIQETRPLFDSAIHPLMSHLYNGYNLTVFAYGQTGSGKTYTMFGNDKNPGIIPNCINALFAYLSTNKGYDSEVTVSYLEIYNEQVNDLIEQRNDLRLYGDASQVNVSNLSSVCCASIEEVLAVITEGETLRHVAHTDYNDYSSRSHTIMIVTLRQRSATVEITSTLTMIDLAGMEKGSRNKERLKEGSHINKSLLTLGNVISKLTEVNPQFVSFRESKLTRLLQPSLMGRSYVVVICTVSTSVEHVCETLNTLRFASKLKRMRVALDDSCRGHVVLGGERDADGGQESELRIVISQIESYLSELYGLLGIEGRGESAVLMLKARVEELLSGERGLTCDRCTEFKQERRLYRTLEQVYREKVNYLEKKLSELRLC